MIQWNRWDASGSILFWVENVGVHGKLHQKFINIVIRQNNGIFIIYFTIENYGIKPIYDQIDTTYVDLCFSNISSTHFVFFSNIIRVM